jgi:thiamine biosynthesis lipoprotein
MPVSMLPSGRRRSLAPIPVEPAAASWPALGTLAALAVTDPVLLPAARELLTAELAAVDAACSSYRTGSELVAANAAARRPGGPVRVSPLLAEAIGAALRAAGQTGGDVDPVCCPASPAACRAQAAPWPRPAGETPPLPAGGTPLAGPPAGGTPLAGPAAPFADDRASLASSLARPPAGGTPLAGPAAPFADDRASLAHSPARLAVAAGASWRQVRLDAAHGLLSLPPGSWLDLGATAKAWAADRAAAMIAARLGCGVLISLGGDVAAHGAAPPGGWRIRVQDNAGAAGARAAGQQDVPAAVVSIRSGGLATAGAGAARWHRGGDVLARILRPHGSALTASPWRLASVTAASCLEARAASIAAIIRGSGAIGWLSGIGLPARLVDAAGQVRTVAGWPADLAEAPDPRGLTSAPGAHGSAGPDGDGTDRDGSDGGRVAGDGTDRNHTDRNHTDRNHTDSGGWGGGDRIGGDGSDGGRIAGDGTDRNHTDRNHTDSAGWGGGGRTAARGMAAAR